MKRILALALAAVMACAALAGCSSSNSGNAGNAGNNTTGNNTSDNTGNTGNGGDAAALSGTVNTEGSTSMADVMSIFTEVFKEMNDGVTVNYSGTGSGAGIEAVLAGTCDIGLSSRALTDDEKASGAVENIVALDGVAIVVNPENPVSDLTEEQIAQIYTGEITNWSEVGGNDAEIAVLGRESGSGTRSAFEEILGIEDACAYTNEYGSTGDVIGSVAGNPNAIGYASLSAVDDTVKAVPVGGVECSEATVQDGSYTIQRPFVMVTVEGTELSEAAQAFLEFAMSADAAQYIELAGAIAPNG